MRTVADKPRANASRQSTRKPPRDPAVSSVPPVVAHGAAMPRLQPPARLLALQRILAGRRLPRAVGEPGPMDHTQIHEAARRGTSGPSGPLPYLDTIQKSFGNHKVSQIEAHTDEAAAAAAGEIDAVAYTTGNHVAFAGKPSLYTVAHEAAHVIQQQAGVQLSGGVGREGDTHEQHADAVAERVVQGRSAEDLFVPYIGTGGPPAEPGAVQHEHLPDMPQYVKNKQGERVQKQAAPAAPVSEKEAPQYSSAWATPLYLDPDLSWETKKRAFFSSFTFEPQSEEEFIARVSSEQAKNPETPMSAAEDEATKAAFIRHLHKQAVAKARSLKGHEPVKGTNIERIRLDGFTSIGSVDKTLGAWAIALVPEDLDLDRPVDVLLFLHGHGGGYSWKADSRIHRIPQQMFASRRNMLGLLPQGTGKSKFGTDKNPNDKGFEADKFIEEALDKLFREPSGVKVTPASVLFAGHSGAGDAMSQMLTPDRPKVQNPPSKWSGRAPSHMREVAFFEAININPAYNASEELSRINEWLQKQLDFELNALNGLPSMDAKNAWLEENGMRFRSYYIPKMSYVEQNIDPNKKWKSSKDAMQATVPSVNEFLFGKKNKKDDEKNKNKKKKEEGTDGWFTKNAGALGGEGSELYEMLRSHYVIVPVKFPHLGDSPHSKVVGQNDSLKDAITQLPHVQKKSQVTGKRVQRQAAPAPGGDPTTEAFLLHLRALKDKETTEAFLLHLQALRDRDQKIRELAVAKAESLMGADWHAPPDSEAFRLSQLLFANDPNAIRIKTGAAGMRRARNVAETRGPEAMEELKYSDDPKTRARAKKDLDAIDALDALRSRFEIADGPVLMNPMEMEMQDAAAFASDPENARKSMRALGVNISWFTTCMTLPPVVAEAAGVDRKAWGPLDALDRTRVERFKALKARNAWVPAEDRIRPEPGDILVMVSYPVKGKKVQMELEKAFFEHIAVLLEVTEYKKDGVKDGTLMFVTADGGKGDSHKGEDKTGKTPRRYNPATQQFIPLNTTNVKEAAEGGKYLLGFWSLPRLPMVSESSGQPKGPRKTRPKPQPGQAGTK